MGADALCSLGFVELTREVALEVPAVFGNWDGIFKFFQTDLLSRSNLSQA